MIMRLTHIRAPEMMNNRTERPGLLTELIEVILRKYIVHLLDLDLSGFVRCVIHSDV